MFTGLSTLRQQERKTQEDSVAKKQLQDYLKKYTGDGGDEPKKKKRKVKKAAAQPAGMQIVDADVTGFKTIEAKSTAAAAAGAAAESEDEDEEGPTIANPEEAEYYKKQLQKAQNFYGQRQDGSGWAVAADAQEDAAAQHPDASPPRRRQRHDSPSPSPPRRPSTAAGSPPDASPPRRRARHDSPDASPPRRHAASPASDASPPRRPTRQASPDASPPRRRARHDSPGASPPRRRARHDSPDASPPRRGAAGSPDASPPRRRARHDSPDVSPPRRGRAASPDASPPRRKARHDSPDASPPRRGRQGGADASPPRRKARHDSPDASPPRRGAADAAGADQGGRMADGTATGLVTADQLAAEAARLKEENERKRRQAAGRHEATVYRDRATGRVTTKEEAAEARAKAGRRRAEPPPEDPQHKLVKGGLAQQRAAEEAQRRMQAEAAKPFARYTDDPERDAELRARAHWGDPMAGRTSGQRSRWEAEDLSAKHQAALHKKKGFIIPQEVPPHSWLRRGVAAPVNRYNIRPGRHWDGVDRSTGFEKQMFETQAARRHKEQLAAVWSMEDW